MFDQKRYIVRFFIFNFRFLFVCISPFVAFLSVFYSFFLDFLVALAIFPFFLLCLIFMLKVQNEVCFYDA
jgi:hypothetical protein